MLAVPHTSLGSHTSSVRTGGEHVACLSMCLRMTVHWPNMGLHGINTL